MNWRKQAYFALLRFLRGQKLGEYYGRLQSEECQGIPSDLSRNLLIQLLDHCHCSVPYYAKLIEKMGDSYHEDPEEYLKAFPVLTKEIIRTHFDELKSSDLSERKWYFNTSGGSTGQPIRLIQDRDYAAKMGAIKLLYSELACNKEIGEKEIEFWTSDRDVTGKESKLTSRFVTSLTNITTLSVFQLDDKVVRKYIDIINKKKPALIVGYATAMHGIARTVERNNLFVAPQRAIITSAGTLYPFMREKIEKVFQCKVFNRYGSREVGDIACERPGLDGLWVAPWGNYLEVVDNNNHRVPNGIKGEILVTSLSNYAMPLLRYQIGDRGILSTPRQGAQILGDILGRSYDAFININGTFIEAGIFMPLLYYRDWIAKYQVIQKRPNFVLLKIVKSGSKYSQLELDELISQARRIMDDDTCEIVFEFVNDIPTTNSGKFRFIVSEVPR